MTANPRRFTTIAKCNRCGLTTFFVIFKDREKDGEVYYTQLCLECYHNPDDPDYKADYCKSSLFEWNDFVQTCAN